MLPLEISMASELTLGNCVSRISQVIDREVPMDASIGEDIKKYTENEELFRLLKKEIEAKYPNLGGIEAYRCAQQAIDHIYEQRKTLKSTI